MKDLEFKIALNEKLCDLVDVILYQYNPCKLDRLNHKCFNRNNLDKIPCCTFFHCSKGDVCVFLKKDGGCSFKNILCKVSLCELATMKADPECLKVLKLIQDIARMYGLMRYEWYH